MESRGVWAVPLKWSLTGEATSGACEEDEEPPPPDGAVPDEPDAGAVSVLMAPLARDEVVLLLGPFLGSGAFSLSFAFNAAAFSLTVSGGLSPSPPE